jgi:hypothetical protein
VCASGWSSTPSATGSPSPGCPKPADTATTAGHLLLVHLRRSHQPRPRGPRRRDQSAGSEGAGDDAGRAGACAWRRRATPGRPALICSDVRCDDPRSCSASTPAAISAKTYSAARWPSPPSRRSSPAGTAQATAGSPSTAAGGLKAGCSWPWCEIGNHVAVQCGGHPFQHREGGGELPRFDPRDRCLPGVSALGELCLVGWEGRCAGFR